MAIDGGIVEVWPELGNGILAVGAEENLPAQTDGGLGGGAVAMELKSLPVQFNHSLGVRGGPEDVVGEEAVAVGCGEFDDLGGADGAVPDEGRHPVQRAGSNSRLVKGRA
ncbi:hypothetical protein GCM10027562_08510 [Arthrobacter pigmenti]